MGSGSHFLVHFNPYQAKTWLRPTRGKGQKARLVLNALVLVSACTALVVKFTLVHPYILADNRHYTFYVWRKFLAKSLAHRIALVPIYAFSLASLANRMYKTQTKLVCFAFSICVVAT